MAVYFVDSSALVKRYHDEAGSERAAVLLDAADRLIAARLTEVEVSAAVVRRGRATRLSVAQLAGVLAAFDHDFEESFDVVELNTPVIDNAIELARKHGLRAADAIQLSCAVLARREAPREELVLLSSDQELNVAAVVEGLQVENPNSPT